MCIIKEIGRESEWNIDLLAHFHPESRFVVRVHGNMIRKARKQRWVMECLRINYYIISCDVERFLCLSPLLTSSGMHSPLFLANVGLGRQNAYIVQSGVLYKVINTLIVACFL